MFVVALAKQRYQEIKKEVGHEHRHRGHIQNGIHQHASVRMVLGVLGFPKPETNENEISINGIVTLICL